MKTPTTIKSHPLHPIFVEFPIVLWIFSFAADIAYLAGANPVWAAIAFYSMIAGIIGAIVAAIPGFIDLLSISDPNLRKMANTHAVLNVIVLALFIINWFWRLTTTMSANGPFVLSIIGVVIMLVAGWIGADLVHEHGVTIDERFATAKRAQA